jgi:hypothetical protein
VTGTRTWILLASVVAVAVAVGVVLRGAFPLEVSGYPLPTSAGDGCRGVGVDSLILHGKLVGSAADVWANDDVAIEWPAGYKAQFAPSLVVVDRQGTVRGREGDEMATLDPWHGQIVCPYRQIVGDAFGPIVVAVILPDPPLPTPEGSRPCSAIVADVTLSLAILRADVAAMVGGATDAASRNQLGNDAGRTLNELNAHPDCSSPAALATWRVDLGYLQAPWVPNFSRSKAFENLNELVVTPLHA